MDSAEEAARDQDIVIVATNTTGHSDVIAYQGKWMTAGQHVNSIGATGGHLREIAPPPAAFANAGRGMVDSYVQVKEESGDSLAALASGAWDDNKIVELPAVVGDQARARDDDAQITLFKSVGTAVQDVMAGFAVYDEARRLGLGREIPDFLEHKLFWSFPAPRSLHHIGGPVGERPLQVVHRQTAR